MKSKRIIFAAILLAASVLSLLLIIGQAQMDPAPTEDRVGFPTGYRDNYAVLYVFDRPDNKQVRVIYGNKMAAAVRASEPFPYGSILVMETYRARVDEQGEVVL